MPRGGKREGAGRRAGSASTKTRDIADKAASEGLTPLEFMLKVLRDEVGPVGATDSDVMAMRFEAAKAAAPYIHPKLSAIEVSGGMKLSHEFSLNELK